MEPSSSSNVFEILFKKLKAAAHAECDPPTITTGFFADIYGRRLSLFFGSILTFLGYLIFSFYSGFNEFFIAEIFLGIGGSLISGADSALIYDTLLELKKDYLG